MKRTHHVLATALIIALLSACATSTKRLNHVRVGMTEEEVVNVMGEPDSVAAHAGATFLNYQLSTTDEVWLTGGSSPFYVKLVNGRVESFGRLGDFDSTKDPTIRVKADINHTTSAP